jgi:hypothetical protein
VSNRKEHRRVGPGRRAEVSIPVRYRRGRFTSGKVTLADLRYFARRAERRRAAMETASELLRTEPKEPQS